MKRTINLPATLFAGAVTTGLLALPISSAIAADDVDAKRDDDGTELVVVADDGDDDGDEGVTDSDTGSDVATLDTTTGTDLMTEDTTGTGEDTDAATLDTTGGTNTDSATGDSNDATASNVTSASMDRDVSVDDNTKDWTRDGGDRTLDESQNKTNDRSRNDTRG